MHLLIALKAFFLVLFNGTLARQVDDALRRRHGAISPPPSAPGSAGGQLPDQGELTSRTPGTAVAPKREAARRPAEIAVAHKPARSEAITLLAVLQREGRFVDFLKEELTGYSDAQIGAVARDLHRDCGKVVERMFAIKPLLSDTEAASVEVPAEFDAARYRLIGNVGGAPPFRGALVHHGWKATTCELPDWVGGEAAARVIAPIEVEVK